MLMETRDSLLLIVLLPAVRVRPGSLVVSGWNRPPAEGDVEIHAMNHVFSPSRGLLPVISF